MPERSILEHERKSVAVTAALFLLFIQMEFARKNHFTGGNGR